MGFTSRRPLTRLDAWIRAHLPTLERWSRPFFAMCLVLAFALGGYALFRAIAVDRAVVVINRGQVITDQQVRDKQQQLEQGIHALEQRAAVPGPQGQRGPSGGERGPQGGQGVQGGQGGQGPQGSPGVSVPGVQGLPGENGRNGNNGITGNPGAAGIPGVPGIPGVTGPAGPTGPVTIVPCVLPTPGPSPSPPPTTCQPSPPPVPLPPGLPVCILGVCL